jgi:hypothetical protein
VLPRAAALLSASVERSANAPAPSCDQCGERRGGDQAAAAGESKQSSWLEALLNLAMPSDEPATLGALFHRSRFTPTRHSLQL